MTRKEALEILEDEELYEQQKGEILAELGSSAFYGGAQGGGGADAMEIARQQFAADTERSDPDGTLREEWDRKVKEAREYMAAFPVKITYRFPYGRAYTGDLARDIDTSDDIPF